MRCSAGKASRYTVKAGSFHCVSRILGREARANGNYSERSVSGLAEWENILARKMRGKWHQVG